MWGATKLDARTQLVGDVTRNRSLQILWRKNKNAKKKKKTLYFKKNEIRSLLICLQWELANARVSSEPKKIMGIIIIRWFVSFRTAWIISGTFWNDQKIYLNSLIFSIYTFLSLN